MISEQVQKDQLRIDSEKLNQYELQNVFSKMDLEGFRQINSKGYEDQLRKMGSMLIQKDSER